MEKYILDYFSMKIYKLALLQKYSNSEKINISDNREILENFININEIEVFMNFLRTLNLKNFNELELFYKCYKENHRVILHQYECSKVTEMITHRKSRLKGVYFPNYNTKELELIMPENFSLDEKVELIENLIDFLPTL